MKQPNKCFKLLAIVLSLLMIFACLPITAFAEGDEFVPENLLQTKIDMANSSGVLFTRSNITVAASTNGGLGSNNVVAGLVDGDLDTAHDVYGLSTTDSRWYGVRYALTESSFVSEFAMYGDYSALPCWYDVYVSEDFDTLHYGANLIGSIKCDGTVKKIEINRRVKYVMVVFNACATGDTNARPKEIQLWSGDETTAFKPSDLIKSDRFDSAKPVLVSGEAVSDYPQNNAKVQTIISNGPTASHTDVYSNSSGNTGIQINLTDINYLGKVLIDAGLFNANGTYNETYTVYASVSLGNLYSSENIVAADVLCQYGRSTIVSINKYAQYVAVVCTAHNGIRIRTICLYDAYNSTPEEEIFVPENVLITKRESAAGVNMFVSNGNTEGSAICFNEAKLAATTDGNTATHVDVSSALDWDPARYTGVVYELSESVLADYATIYSGFDALPETWKVYASDSLDTLYNAANKMGEVQCGDASVKVKIGKTVKYVAFFCAACSGNIRVKEFELWTADPADIFVSHNVLLNNNKVSAAKPVVKWVSSGNVDESAVISDQNMALLTDGDSNAHGDFNGTLDWDPARYLGAEFTLDDVYFIGEIKLFASIGESFSETYDIYASDTLGALYSPANLVVADAETTGDAIVATVNKNIQYIAFFNKSYTGNPRIKEIEAWTADPSAVPDEPDPEPNDNSLKVLTIGNSFAENASIYASEIALANGKDLTFGYLKSPSCSIEKHYNAAVNDIAGFKFQVTSPDGKGGITKTTVKDGANTTVDAPNAEHGATVKDALAYTDWDVIVLQQESYSARSYDTFGALPSLVEYVKTACPDAKLMFHEVWRWGEWDADAFASIKANSEKAARANALEIIPSGLAFEYAREESGNVNYPNEDDGHYQHANTFGQYIAGVCYVNTLFGIECDSDAFAKHPYINPSEGVAAMLTESANKACNYYDSYGDVNFDGVIDSSDIVLLKKALLDIGTVDMTLADANNDGYVNILDLIVIKKMLLEAA